MLLPDLYFEMEKNFPCHQSCWQHGNGRVKCCIGRLMSSFLVKIIMRFFAEYATKRLTICSLSDLDTVSSWEIVFEAFRRLTFVEWSQSWCSLHTRYISNTADLHFYLTTKSALRERDCYIWCLTPVTAIVQWAHLTNISSEFYLLAQSRFKSYIKYCKGYCGNFYCSFSFWSAYQSVKLCQKRKLSKS